MFFRWAERRNDEHRKWRARPGGATESAWSRPAHNEHPGSENAGQGARREHHQRIANGLKFNVRPRKAVSTRLRPNRGHALNTAGVTRSENYHSPLEQLDPSRNWRKHCNGQTDRQTRSLVPLSAAFLVKRLVNRSFPSHRWKHRFIGYRTQRDEEYEDGIWKGTIITRSIINSQWYNNGERRGEV